MTHDCAWLSVRAILTNPRTKNYRTRQRQPPANGVHYGRTGKINEANFFQPTLTSLAAKQAAPRPSAKDRVYKQRDDHTVGEVADELGTLGHGARNDGSCCRCENRLEEQERVVPTIAVCSVSQAKHRRANKPAVTLSSKHQSKADYEKGNRPDGKIHQVLHQNVYGVFGSRETGFNHRKACLHEKHQKRSNTGPNNIDVKSESFDVGFLHRRRGSFLSPCRKRHTC